MSDIFEPNSKDIYMFGLRLHIYEINTKDFIEFTEFLLDNNQNSEDEFKLFQSIWLISSAFKYNLKVMSRLNPKRFITKKLINKKFLIKYYKYLDIESLLSNLFELQGMKGNKERSFDKSYLGQTQGYSLLMNFFGWTKDQIDNLPISKYLSYTNEALNIGNLLRGGEYKTSYKDQLTKYKKMLAFSDIQDLKRQGKWQKEKK